METLVNGYKHSGYADALSEFAEPLPLHYSGGHLLRRRVIGSEWADAAGCYPLFSCVDWAGLPVDLESLKSGLVSVVLVADPFGDFTPAQLHSWFPELSRPFKAHFVVDLKQSPMQFVAPHHRRNALKALGSLVVEGSDSPLEFLDEWVGLYQNLIERHRIEGLRAFSRTSFGLQLQVPGVRIFRALDQNSCVGATLWYVQGDAAYYHLGSYSERGYKMNASHAIFWRAIDYFQSIGVRWLNLGAGAGLVGDNDGLTRFKRGWSTGTRMAYLCGRILHHHRYKALCAARGVSPTIDYFPAYRVGEFS